MANSLDRQARIEELQTILNKGDLKYALRYMCDIANEARETGEHKLAREMIDRACQLIGNHPELPITWLYFGRDQDCHKVYRAWRDIQEAESEQGGV